MLTFVNEVVWSLEGDSPCEECPIALGSNVFGFYRVFSVTAVESRILAPEPRCFCSLRPLGAFFTACRPIMRFSSQTSTEKQLYGVLY